MEEAVELYRGDCWRLPLYDEWIFPERERRRNAYLAALMQLVSQAPPSTRFPSVESPARSKSSRSTRGAKTSCAKLMAQRSESGDRAGALAEYERFAQLLRLELKVDTDGGNAGVARERLRAARRLEAGCTVRSRCSRRCTIVPPILPFVGRHTEMAQLLETWSRAARGRGACVFVGGEARRGQVAHRSSSSRTPSKSSGGRVLVGATGSPEATPYESIVDALRSALPLVASLKADISLSAVAELLPEIRARLPALPPLPHIDAESERIRLFESLVRCLAGLAKPRPLLLVLEDLHWAQPASIALLQFLLRRISGMPVMIVVTYRDNETPRPHPLHRLRIEARAAACAQSLSLTNALARRPARVDRGFARNPRSRGCQTACRLRWEPALPDAVYRRSAQGCDIAGSACEPAGARGRAHRFALP